MIDKIIVDTDYNFAYIVDYELSGLNHTILWNSKYLADDVLRDVRLILSDKHALPDMVGNPLSWLILSERLARIIKQADPSGIQILECHIENLLGKKLEGYFIINILNCLDVMNLKKSDFEKEDGVIDMVYDWVFDADRVPLRKMLFREKNFIYPVFSTRDLALDFKGMKGVMFEACKLEK